jgi:hypothetical protein
MATYNSFAEEIIKKYAKTLNKICLNNGWLNLPKWIYVKLFYVEHTVNHIGRTPNLM